MVSPDPADPLPRATTDLVGHEAAERAFLDAWATGRLSHAWLIAGRRGIGKATLAYRIARFVLGGGSAGGGGLFGDGPAGLAADPAGTLFRRVASGAHPDLCVVERAEPDAKGARRKEIPVDAVREIAGFLALTPAEGGWRVVIVDAVDELNRSGANALLKVLEEPPARSLLMLICHAPGRLLPTIRSRCRLLTLRPLALQAAAGVLSRRRPALAEDEALALARLADGSVGVALELADQGGLDLYREMLDLLGGMPALDVPALHAFAERVGRSEEGTRTLGELFGVWLSGAAVAGFRGRADEVQAGESELAARLLATAGLDRWLDVWEKTTQSFGRAEAVNLDRKQVVLNAFLSLERLCRP